MATVKFHYRSKRENAPITLRLLHKKEFDYFVNTELRINKEHWNSKKGIPKTSDEKARQVKTKLINLESYILDIFNEDYNKGEEITKDWLKLHIDIFFKRHKEETLSDLLIDNIQRIIDTSATRKNGKGGIGLSEGRKKNYKALIKLLEKYQTNKKLRIKDINLRFKNDFLVFMNKNNYSDSYSLKMLSNIKTVCNDAKINEIEISPQLDKIEIVRPKNNHIIYLTPEELIKIEKVKLKSDSLNNARKWLLIGCNIGQRAGDLLNLNESNLANRSGLNLIEFQQEKTTKLISIPLFESTLKLLEKGFPKKISIQKFNDYIKVVCKEAKINQLTTGKKNSKKLKRQVIGEYEKWELITSHTCRRSYATNLYGKMPTSLIMQITGHTTERSFLGYIGKSGMDYAQQIAEFYSKMAIHENNTPQELTENLKAI